MSGDETSEDAPWATLGLREEAAVFVSASQNARVLAEGWVEASLFCPNCGTQPIRRFAANRPVADFLCEACAEEYELKSQTARLGARVVDGAFATMSARLQAENNPNLLVARGVPPCSGASRRPAARASLRADLDPPSARRLTEGVGTRGVP